MGLVALRVGLLAAVVVHAGVDVAYLALAAPQLQPGILALPAALLLVGMGAMVATRWAASRATFAPVASLAAEAGARLRARLGSSPRGPGPARPGR
jgi:hypothetical protein